MVSTVHQKQPSKVKTTVFISITTKVNKMTVKKGVFSSTPNPKPWGSEILTNYCICFCYALNRNILVMYTENILVCPQVVTDCTLSPSTYTAIHHVIYLGFWMLTGGTRDCSSQLMARLERSGGGTASISSFPFTGASGTCTSSRTKNVLNQKWNIFSCKGNKKMKEVMKPFHLTFLTNNIFILFKCVKSPVLRRLFHLTSLHKQHSVCTTTPTLNFLWFPLPSKMMKIKSLLRLWFCLFWNIGTKVSEKQAVPPSPRWKRIFQDEDGNSTFNSSNGTKLLNYNVPSLKTVIFSYHHKNIKSPSRTAITHHADNCLIRKKRNAHNHVPKVTSFDSFQIQE